MGMNLVQKIIKSHLVSGDMIPGQEIGLKIDQTLTQDATGTMAYLQFEAMGIDRVKTRKSVAYADHNTLQSGFENADDHKYIQTVAKKHGIYFSRPGNGICHQVHLERFSIPGQTLLGSDSHTPSCGGAGMLAMGAGGLDVAVAMGGGAYYIPMPSVIKINLTNSLTGFASAKDVILYILKLLSVKGGVGKVIEYGGPGIMSLSVPERATITNMGAELGATASIFPADEITYQFLMAQARGKEYNPLKADDAAEYEQVIDIDLSTIKPMAACPHSPDNVVEVSEIEGIKVDQVCIGSCTNSSYVDLMKVSEILKDQTVHPDVSLVISPGSRQVLDMISRNGALSNIISAGARIIECACGPCIGMGQSPRSAGVSLRTFNRNFEGRSGTQDASIYLVSPETAAVSAIFGEIKSPEAIGKRLNVEQREDFLVNDNMIDDPAAEGESVDVVKGPNIKDFPISQKLSGDIEKSAILKVGDNITTDHIMPAGSKILPYRSNIPYMSNFCFEQIDESFPQRAKDLGGGFIIAGENYGQGSSREHAALVPLYLGISAVITKSFARIHEANLINSGILPFTFADAGDYDKIDQGDVLLIEDPKGKLLNGDETLTVKNVTKGFEFSVNVSMSRRLREVAAAGGLINHTKEEEGK